MKKILFVSSEVSPYAKTGGLADVAGSLPKELLNYLNKNYKYGKSELYTSFIERCLSFLKKDGSLAMLTLHTWMFIKSFKDLRKYIINNYPSLCVTGDFYTSKIIGRCNFS